VDVEETKTSARRCKLYTNCNVPSTPHTTGAWVSTKAGTHNDRTCTALTNCVYSTHYESKLATRHSDRVCTPLTTCGADQFVLVPKTEASNRVCEDKTICTATEWQVSNGSTTTNRACKALTVCEGDEYQTEAETATADRKCASHTECKDDQYQSVAATPDSDRQCSAITTCGGHQWQTVAPTYVRDRSCEDHTVCTIAQWASTTAGTHRNRVCSALRTCDFDNEYETQAPTGWQSAPYQPWLVNRVCVSLTTCKDDEWEDVAKSTTSDRHCKSHSTECTGTQWQTQAHGTHQDRECKDCLSEPACQWNQYRKGCGGSSAGTCVYDCDEKYNCFVGRSGTKWHDAVTQWSKHTFPHWPQVARTAVTVNLLTRARGAAKGIVIAPNGKVSIKANGGDLQIGHKTCGDTEYESSPITATTTRVCTSKPFTAIKK